MTDFRDKLRNSHCQICPLHESAQFVCLMGSGPSRAKIMIVGEAPGAREDDEHKAFVGKAGQLLEIALQNDAHIQRDDCYVTNVSKCRPPYNRTPERKEIKACVESYFWDEVAHVKPNYMLLLGNSALVGVTKRSGITKHAGTVWTKVLGGVPVKIMATLHPAAVLRNPKWADMFVADITRFGRLVRGETETTSTKVKIIRSVAQLRWLIDKLMEEEEISYDIETYVRPAEAPFIRNNLMDWHGDDSRIVSIAFSWKEGVGACVPLWHEKTPWKDPDAVLQALKPALTRPDAKYIAHNGKFDARWLHSKGIPVPQTADTMLMGHMLEENRPKGLKSLSRTILGVDAYDVGEDLGTAYRMPLRRLAVYNIKDTDYTLRLYHIFRSQLREAENLRTARVYMKLMMPASNALVDIERHGVWIDPQRWEQRRDQAQENVSKLYRYINRFVGPELRPINLRSPQQVAKWLYGDLGLPILEHTKTGNPGTREAVLLRLAAEHDHTAITALLKYRKWSKYLNTYLLPWQYEHRNSATGRIHSSYKLFGTVTGRLSGEGGIQQVPRDTFIRSIIGAPPGWVFVQADYSQVELRLAAMIAGERNMTREFMEGKDIHLSAASKRLGLSPEKVSKEQRKKAKARNFGYLYGMGAKKFVNYCFENWDLTISLEEAERDRRQFFEEYPALVAWHKRQRRLARRYGVVYNFLGRARHLPDIISQDKDVRAEAERQAINSPVQSAASDLMLHSLVQLHKKMDPSEAVIVGTVHDSILFEVKEEHLQEYCQMIKETMEDMRRVERAFNCEITVPIVAEIETGSHWSESEPWEPHTQEEAA